LSRPLMTRYRPRRHSPRASRACRRITSRPCAYPCGEGELSRRTTSQAAPRWRSLAKASRSGCGRTRIPSDAA
jgi:hypothetical protein